MKTNLRNRKSMKQPIFNLKKVEKKNKQMKSKKRYSNFAWFLKD